MKTRLWAWSRSRLFITRYVMFKKKDEELQAKFEEKKVKQNKLKTLKKTLSNIRQNEFQIKEEEYDEIKNVINKKIKDGFFGLLNPVQKLGNLTDKDNYFEKKFQIYKHKTEKNMTRVLMERFAKLNTHILQITGGHAINVVKVLLNDGLTVLDVFWEYEFDLHSWDIQMRPNQRRAQTDEVSRKLETYARSHISFKMMREMNLRKMVEVRFYFSQAVKIKDKITDEMQGTLVSMAKDRLAERVAAEGLDPERLTDRDFQRELGFVKMKFEDKIADVIDYKSMRKRYKSQDEGASGEGGQKIKRDAAGKRLRDNRNPDGSRKKVPKVPKSSKFWGALK